MRRPSSVRPGTAPCASSSRREHSARFSAAPRRWRPTTSAPRIPRRISSRHGSRMKSSWGGKGMCRKKPMRRSGPALAEHRGDELQVVVVHPDDGAGRRGAGRRLGEALVDADVGLPPLLLEASGCGWRRGRAARGCRWRSRRRSRRRRRPRGHGDERDVVVLERRGVLVGQARPAHPARRGGGG